MSVVETAEGSDLAAIEAILRASPEAPQWTSAQMLSAIEAAPSAAAPRRTVLTLRLGGAIAGFAVASALPGDGAELESIAVAPQSRGLGCGRALLEAIAAWSSTQGSDVLRLEVRAGNQTALRLYGRCGFVPCGVRPRYYDRPVEDAVLMKLSPLPRQGTA